MSTGILQSGFETICASENTTFFNEHRKSAKLFVQKARLKLIRAHIRHLMGFTSCLTVLKWQITCRNWFIFLNVLDSPSLARKQNWPMPDTYSHDNFPPIVLKLWVLTRVVKIAIKLCSRAAMEHREKSKNSGDLGHICLHFAEQKKESLAGTFSISRSGFTLWPGTPAVLSGPGHWDQVSQGKIRVYGFLWQQEESGAPPYCSFDYREIIGLLPKKAIWKQ